MAHGSPHLVVVAVWMTATALGGCGSGASGGTSPDQVAGSGTMSGTIDGRTFDTVGASYVIGHPDDPDRTVVILVFDRPIACSEVTQAGWDARVADGSQVLELKLIGKSAGEYPVATGGQPTAGESDVNYTLTSTSSTPAEVSATEGTVTLEVNGTASASGTFDLSFPGGAAAGSFAAAGCSGGREP